MKINIKEMMKMLIDSKKTKTIICNVIFLCTNCLLGFVSIYNILYLSGRKAFLFLLIGLSLYLLRVYLKKHIMWDNDSSIAKGYLLPESSVPEPNNHDLRDRIMQGDSINMFFNNDGKSYALQGNLKNISNDTFKVQKVGSLETLTVPYEDICFYQSDAVFARTVRQTFVINDAICLCYYNKDKRKAALNTKIAKIMAHGINIHTGSVIEFVTFENIIAMRKEE